MKLILTIFTIALVAQVSFGASIQRAKRNADESSQSMKEFLNDIMSELKSKLEGMYMEIPETAAFASLRKEIKGLIDSFDENKGDSCLLNFVKIGLKFSTVGEEIGMEESEESRIINKIAEKYFDDEFLEKFDIALKNVKKPNTEELMETC